MQPAAKPAPIAPVKPLKPRPAAVPEPETSAPEQSSEPAPETGASMTDIITQVDAFQRNVNSYESAADFAKDLESLRNFIF